MDILTAVHHAACRLRDATTPPDVTAAPGTSPTPPSNVVRPVTIVASQAADTGEAAALALLHLGDGDDAPAYLAAADAFALAREELEHAAAVVAPGTVPASKSGGRADAGGNAWMDDKADGDTDRESLTWDAASTDAPTLETALADLAAALVTALAAASMRLAQPEHVLALGRAGLAAADAHRATHRDPGDARHLR